MSTAVATQPAGSVTPAISFDHMKQLAKSIAASKLFGVKTEDEALALMMISQAEGRHPGLAVRDYHIIQGRPSLKADTMLARFQAAGGKVEWRVYTDTNCVGVFSHPQAGSVTIAWSFEQAKAIGLTSKDNWKHYPRAMLRARCISEGVRTCFPGVSVGVYTPEEIEDGAEIDVTPPKTAAELERVTTEAVQSVATALTLPEVEEHIDAMMGCDSIEALQTAYMAGHEHAKRARDTVAKKRFADVYAIRFGDLKGAKT